MVYLIQVKHISTIQGGAFLYNLSLARAHYSMLKRAAVVRYGTKTLQPWYGHSFKLSQGFAEYAREDLEQAWVELQQAKSNMVNILWGQKLWPEPANLANEKQGKRKRKKKQR